MAESVNGAHGAATSAPPGPGHNGPDEGLFRKHLLYIIAANREMDEARAKRNAIRKRAKAEGIELKKLDAIITMMDWEPGEVRDHFRTLHQYAEWGNLPLYTQNEFTFEPPAAAALPALDWEKKGFIAGTTGKGSFGEPPDDCPAANVQDWMRGWHDSQEANAKAMAPRPEPVVEDEPENEGGEALAAGEIPDPDEVKKQARKLKGKGWADKPAPATAH